MGSNHMHEHFRRVFAKEKPIQDQEITETPTEPALTTPIESDMDKLNRFLITVANTERVGIRHKILMIKKFIDVLGNKED